MTAAQRRPIAQKLYDQGLTVREIAEQLGVSIGTAHRDTKPEAAERYRIASREHRRKPTDQE